ncbi:MAG: CocE/NonD family hydrolase, partial [Flavobacteriales bacterium]
MLNKNSTILIIFLLTITLKAHSQQSESFKISEHYDKKEYKIPMRDGTKLFTAVYTPKDKSNDYPILFQRTPYSCRPYGEGNFKRRLGPSRKLMKDKYIFVYQDVRGRYMSEGEFTNLTPHIPNKEGDQEV